MAGTGADPDQRQGSGASDRRDLAGRTARTWKVGPQKDCSLGRFGSYELGQWQETRLSKDEGRTNGSTECALHVDLGGDEIQPVDSGTVSAVVEEGEGKEGRSHRVYAEVPNHLECDDARQGPVQADGYRLRWTGFPFKGGFCS